ncbi:MAG: porin family protein [Gammaproteobacteria bacterium]|nr:porin family protein [Gammaproteobacteria bacterium]
MNNWLYKVITGMVFMLLAVMANAITDSSKTISEFNAETATLNEIYPATPTITFDVSKKNIKRTVTKKQAKTATLNKKNRKLVKPTSKLKCQTVQTRSNNGKLTQAYSCNDSKEYKTVKAAKRQNIKSKKLKSGLKTKAPEFGKIYPAPLPPKATPITSLDSAPKDYNHELNRLELKLNPDKNHKSIISYNPIEKVNEKSAIGHPYLGVIGGMSIAKIGKDQRDPPNDAINGYDQYLPTNGHKVALLYGVNGGYEFKLGPNALLSLGAGIYHNSNFSSDGQVYYNYPPTDIDNSSDKEHSFNYKYKLQSIRLMFETQLAWQFDLNKSKLIPFVMCGIGPSWNFANNYEESLVNPLRDPRPGFKSHTKTNFAYQVGAGIAIPFNVDHDRVSIAYRYSNLGKARFDNRETYPLYQLDIGKIKTQEIYIGYTHLFDF